MICHSLQIFWITAGAVQAEMPFIDLGTGWWSAKLNYVYNTSRNDVMVVLQKFCQMQEENVDGCSSLILCFV